jgi:hypothetical protein
MVKWRLKDSILFILPQAVIALNAMLYKAEGEEFYFKTYL